MHWKRPQSLLLVPACVLVVGVAACGSSSTSTGSSSAAQGGGQASLTAQNTMYDPTTLSVPANSQVTLTFTNKDSITHSVTFDDNSQSVDAQGGATQTLSFMSGSSGTTIAFHCKYHPTQMKGTITVGGSGGSGGGGTTQSSQSSSANPGY